MTEYKQAIVLRADLGMGKGKLVAQGCHASIDAFEKAKSSKPEWVEAWKDGGCRKIAVKVQSERELVGIFMAAKKARLPCSLITDAGHTQVEPGSKTAVAIGPAPESEIDEITDKLKLL
ncbi:MAG: peptidyl-tRNA hydrolase Pth2 [Candidatus Micrarchaeia archaeon]|jgi:PTH2 family peptidyl-tRNA hydrolase